MQERTRARLQGLSLGVAGMFGAAIGSSITYLLSGDASPALFLVIAALSLLIGGWNLVFPGTMLAMRQQRARVRRDAGASLRILGSTLLAFGAVLALVLLVSALL